MNMRGNRGEIGGYQYRVSYDAFSAGRGAHLFNDKSQAREFARKHFERKPEIYDAYRSIGGEFRWMKA